MLDPKAPAHKRASGLALQVKLHRSGIPTMTAE
jgi:hypothetical protein